MAVRRNLLGLLVAALALSAYALWKEDRARPSVVLPTNSGEDRYPSPMAAESIRESQMPPLPTSLTPLHMEPALRDIFAGPSKMPAGPVVQLAAPMPQPQVMRESLLQPSPVPLPVAPPVTWRFLGRMSAPDGKSIVMIAREDVSVAVDVGAQLDDGYIVKILDSDKIRLTHPPTGTLADIPIPPSQSP